MTFMIVDYGFYVCIIIKIINNFHGVYTYLKTLNKKKCKYDDEELIPIKIFKLHKSQTNSEFACRRYEMRCTSSSSS